MPLNAQYLLAFFTIQTSRRIILTSTPPAQEILLNCIRLCAQSAPFYKDADAIASEPTLMTSLTLIIFAKPLSPNMVMFWALRMKTPT